MQPFDDLSIPHSIEIVDAQRAVWIAGPKCLRHEVVGEVYNPDQMRRVVSAVHGRTEALIQAWLLPDPQNPHDPNAIIVWVLGGKVGYLARELAFQWKPIFASLYGRYGAHVACQAQLDPPSHSNQGSFGVVVWLPALPLPQPTPSQRVPSPPFTAAGAGQSLPLAAQELEQLRTELRAARSDIARTQAEAKSAQDATTAAHRELRAAQEALKAATRDPDELERIRGDIVRAKAEFEAAHRALRSIEEALDIQSFGFYAPKYGFESSAQYTARLKGTRDEQQMLIKEDKAAPCDTKWSVGGSAAEGKKMIRQQSKLMLRAFNGECDAAIAKVRYDNVTTLEQRITKAYDDINKLGEVQRVFISRRYFDLKLAELHLVHEHREKVQQEKDEQKRIKEQMREEQRAQEEIDRAKADAEKEEAKSAAALARARAELAAVDAAAAAEAARIEAAGVEAASAEVARAATAKQHEKLEALVNRLETDLKDALDRKAKAIARAQLTKSGHVYVLSNIGSFGDGIYKIGMTRRLEPLERVEELGDASVPFPFDVHAIIYSEDAPALEGKLHRAFAARRVNMVNHRKEYFRVTLEEIRDAVQSLHGLVTFLLVPAAEEYRKTQAAADASPTGLAAAPPPELAPAVSSFAGEP
ncbi:DUF4041 domain-containing protein [Sorangium sp. KYC3313]|uniref:DUF4041 domain-containing protein n=1 Tax=Sorangium sp. KYC3313 TaxID=3449740 RepID=UPI003F8A8590